MATNSTPKSISGIRRGVFFAAAAMALAACGGEPDVVASEPTIAEQTTLEPVVIAATIPPATSEAPATTAPSPSTTTEAPATTFAPTTAAPTTTTTEAPATVVRPEDVAARVSNEHGLIVVTAADDPLNVRLGPGVQHDMIDQLEHLTSGITATHTVELASSGPWALVELHGEVLGWVHAGHLEGVGHSSTCQRTRPTPADPSLVKSVEADVDQDGEADQIEVFTAQFTDDTALMWVEVAFANGGYTASIVTQANSVAHFPGFMEVEVGRLQYLTHDGPLEIALTVTQGASHSGWTVLTFDRNHCEFVPTLLDSNPFGYSIGASAIASWAGCTFGAHGELTFSTSVQDFNSGGWSVKRYELRGTQWNLIEELSYEADPTLEIPLTGSPTDCFSI